MGSPTTGYRAICPRCGYETNDPFQLTCECGSPLEVKVDVPFRREEVKGERSMWRYLSFFPYVERPVTMGEGWTPLVKFGSLYLKLDYLNPTGSFKDRGASALLSTVAERINLEGGFISEDSSGNAGAAVAAYSARAGVKARIYVPSTAEGPKIDQIRAYGAELIRVEGSREEITRKAMEPEPGKRYLGHVYHPIFRDGMRTVAYEVVEQLRWEPPDLIFLPVSAGTLLMGVIRGLQHLLSSEVLSSLPKVVACQAEQASPVYHRLKGLPYSPPPMPRSVADALISTKPPLLELMVQELRSLGDAEAVSDEEILKAWKDLSRSGFYVEPSSAVAYASYKKWTDEGLVDKGDKVVVVLTGHGLKRGRL